MTNIVAERISVNSRPLSERQAAIIRFVQKYMQEHNHAPSIREIGEGVGISSTSNVVYHINRLIDHGYMYKQPGTSRTLVVLSPACDDSAEPIAHDWMAEMAALRAENRRLREWCRHLEQERAWEKKQRQEALAG